MTTPDQFTAMSVAAAHVAKRRADATAAFLEAFTDTWTLSDLGQALSCVEVDVFAEMLRAHDKDGAADVLVGAHAEADDVGDRHFTGDLSELVEALEAAGLHAIIEDTGGDGEVVRVEDDRGVVIVSLDGGYTICRYTLAQWEVEGGSEWTDVATVKWQAAAVDAVAAEVAK